MSGRLRLYYPHRDADFFTAKDMNISIPNEAKQAYVDYAASVIQDNNAQTMTSLQIAEITGKQHKSVMRAIRNMESAWENICGRKFALTSQKVEMPNGGFREEPCYALNKTECLYIATKFNDEARAKLVLRWQALEEAEKARQPKVPTSFKEALLLAAAQQEQIERQQLLIEQKTEQLDESKEWFSIKRWAQLHRKNWRNYKWRVLKALSFELGFEPKKIFDANYDEVNIYHRSVFEAAYGK